jgi:hypothetical protein
MVSRIVVALLGLALAAFADAALRDQTELTRQCSGAVDTLWPQWRFPNVSTEVREWATSRKEDPTVAYGDFDDDGRKDVALLIYTASQSGSIKIVACLSSIGATKPVVVETPYCSDGITRVSKGQRYYDFATELEGTFPKDGIHAYCFEKAGATYIFSDGSFRQIVDSD